MSLARALLEAQGAATSNTLVIHLDDRSTDFLRPIYDGHGYPVISGQVTRKELTEAIKSHERIYMLGHGGPGGLFARPFTIGDEFGPLLAEKKDNLCIWCNADAYAVRNKLTGLVSGMFISEVLEARMFGIEATQAEVDASNNLFSKMVRQLLDSGEPLSKIRECYTHATCKITKFNNERLYVFEGGTPTPALHATSLAHPPDSNRYSRRYDHPDDRPSDRYADRPSDRRIDQDDLFTGTQEFRWGGEQRSDHELEWFREVYEIATIVGYPLHNLSEQDQYFLEMAYDDGWSPREALQRLAAQ